MKAEEKREQAIQSIVSMLRTISFQLEFKVKKNPQGIKVIVEVTQEQMDSILENAAKKEKED